MSSTAAVGRRNVGPPPWSEPAAAAAATGGSHRPLTSSREVPPVVSDTDDWLGKYIGWVIVGSVAVGVVYKLIVVHFAPVAPKRSAPSTAAVTSVDRQNSGAIAGEGNNNTKPTAAVRVAQPPPTAAPRPFPKPSHLNRWEIIRSLGSGSYGRVTLARHTTTGQYAAMKEVPIADASSVHHEFELLVALPPHHNVVQVLGVENHNNRARLFLEYCPNGTLLDIIRPGVPLSEALVRSYAKQILEGLAFLHHHNLLHRDIKPANVLVDASGVLKIADFGLSRHMDSMSLQGGSGQNLQAGSPAYMSPESVRGVLGVGSDMWAVGATMTHLLTGQLPWSHVPAFRNGREALLLYIGTTLSDHPAIPSTVSVQAQDLLRTLFNADPAARGTAEEALHHPFFAMEPTPTECGCSSIATSTTFDPRMAFGSGTLDGTLSTTATSTMRTASVVNAMDMSSHQHGASVTSFSSNAAGSAASPRAVESTSASSAGARSTGSHPSTTTADF